MEKLARRKHHIPWLIDPYSLSVSMEGLLPSTFTICSSHRRRIGLSERTEPVFECPDIQVGTDAIEAHLAIMHEDGVVASQVLVSCIAVDVGP